MKPSNVYLNAAKRLDTSMHDVERWSAYRYFMLPFRGWPPEGENFMALFGIAYFTKHEAIIALCLMAAIAESEGD